MSCCPPPGAEIFTERQARRDARRYRRKGLDRSARLLAASVAGAGRDVLEVGGGVGALQLELLRSGAERATNVELSPAYEEEAGALIREAGLEDRVERRVGDFARDSAGVEPADVVVLNRVVCCYPDVDALVGAAATKTRRVLALTYPRRAWWTRLGSAGINTFLGLTRKEFRTFVHSPERIAAAAEAAGLRPRERGGGIVWQLASFERSSRSSSISVRAGRASARA